MVLTFSRMMPVTNLSNHAIKELHRKHNVVLVELQRVHECLQPFASDSLLSLNVKTFTAFIVLHASVVFT